MSWTAAVAITVGTIGAAVDSNNAAHAQTAQTTASANAQATANNQIAAVEQQKTNAQNQQAAATQVAQARIKAISGADSNSASPSFGNTNPYALPGSTAQPATGTGTVGGGQGKATVGG